MFFLVGINADKQYDTNLFNHCLRLMMQFVKVPGLKGKIYIPEKQLYLLVKKSKRASLEMGSFEIGS